MFTFSNNVSAASPAGGCELLVCGRCSVWGNTNAHWSRVWPTDTAPHSATLPSCPFLPLPQYSRQFLVLLFLKGPFDALKVACVFFSTWVEEMVTPRRRRGEKNAMTSSRRRPIAWLISSITKKTCCLVLSLSRSRRVHALVDLEPPIVCQWEKTNMKERKKSGFTHDFFLDSSLKVYIFCTILK